MSSHSATTTTTGEAGNAEEGQSTRCGDPGDPEFLPRVAISILTLKAYLT